MFQFSKNSTLPFAVYFGESGLDLAASLGKGASSPQVVAPTFVDHGDGYYSIIPAAAHRDTLGMNRWRVEASNGEVRPWVEQVADILPNSPQSQPITFAATSGGEPVSGLAIRIAGRQFVTGTNGQFAVPLDPGEYPAELIAPSGFELLPPIVVTVANEPVVLSISLTEVETVTTPAPGPQFDPASRRITLTAGDDYSADNGTALVIPVGIPGIDLADCHAVCSAQGEYLPVIQGTATLTDLQANPKIRLEWTRAQTLQQPSPKYEWGIVILDSEHRVRTVLRGPFCLLPPSVNPSLTAGG